MKTLRCIALLLALSTVLDGATARPLFGFTPFPYDSTEQAIVHVQDILRDHATVYALHFDDGVPWDEMLEGKPLPAKIQREWDGLVRAAPPGRPVYLGLTPLAKDRKSLAPGRGENDYLPLPRSLRRADLDDDKVKESYLEYARRAVRQFKPDYLNLGIEAGELASREPRRWSQFENLYLHVAGALKRENPQMMIGISYGLQSLRKPEVAKRVKALVEQSDYLGLSFYPHASPFAERFGEPPLRDGEDAWREPLEWVRTYTRKPIAICETGYLTRTVTLNNYKLTLKGDTDLQTRYVRELAEFAKRDSYLFVVWYLAVDYDRLYERMGGDSAANEVNLLWRNIGLWDGNVQPKPALKEWRRAIADVRPGTPSNPNAPLVASGIEIGFSSERQIFQTGPGTKMVLDGDDAVWTYDYRQNDWAWALRELGMSLPAGTVRMKLRIKSDRKGPIFLQLEERSGETFFAMLDPSLDWSDLTIELESLKPDPAKRKDGVLQPDQVVKLLVADSAGRDRAEGRRSIWFSRWTFE